MTRNNVDHLNAWHGRSVPHDEPRLVNTQIESRMLSVLNIICWRLSYLLCIYQFIRSDSQCETSFSCSNKTTETTPFNMDEVAANVRQWQKERLQEVADGMLKIYRTLVRMQFIGEHMIEEGPHNLDKMLPLYKERNVDDSIIYLYSILPYVSDCVDFFQRGATLDIRNENSLDEARNPMYDDHNPLHPWQTALSSIANHDTALIYDARRHVIGMFAQQYSGSTDPRLRSPTPGDSLEDETENIAISQATGGDGSIDDQDNECDSENRRPIDAEDDAEDESDGNQAGHSNADSGHSGDSDDSDDSDEDNGSDEEDERYVADDQWHAEMDARWAPKVLRDIVIWYEDLSQLPGNGEYGGWDPDITLPLFIKHGWPSGDFDGEAFLVDKAIRDAESELELDTIEDGQCDLNDLEAQLRCQIDQNEGAWGFSYDQAIIDQTDDLEKEWLSRTRMFKMERARIILERRIHAEKEKRDKLQTDDMVPNERQLVLEELEDDLDYARDRLQEQEERINQLGGLEKASRERRNELCELRRQVRVYDLACQRYKHEEHVTPVVKPIYYDDRTDFRERLWYWKTKLESDRQEIAAAQRFKAGIPDRVQEARRQVDMMISMASVSREQMEVDRAESTLRALGYTGWPLD